MEPVLGCSLFLLNLNFKILVENHLLVFFFVAFYCILIFQLRIEQLINEKDFAGAFQEALTAADLNLVMMVCQSCDPLELFGQDPCPLNQPILLSLIQQLSVDLSSDTELKNRYDVMILGL